MADRLCPPEVSGMAPGPGVKTLMAIHPDGDPIAFAKPPDPTLAQ